MKTTSPTRSILLAGFLSVCSILPFSPTLASSSANKAADAWSQSVALEKNGDYAGALAKMTDFIQAGGEAYLAELRSGWLSYMSKDYKTAARHYEAASQIATTAVSPLLGLANSYRATKETVREEKTCEQVLLRDPVNYTALIELPGISFDKRDYHKASQYYEAVLRNYPEDTSALSGDAWAQLYLNKKSEAASAFQRLLTLSPSYPYAQQGYESASKTFIGLR